MPERFAKDSHAIEDIGLKIVKTGSHSQIKHSMTTQSPHTSFTNAQSSKETQGQQTYNKANQKNTQASAPASISAKNTPGVDTSHGSHGQRGTDGDPKGQRLTQQTLLLHQSDVSRFRADPDLVLATQQAQHARLEAAARTLDFTLPTSATRNYTGMKQVGRYMAEQVDGEGPLTGMTRRR